MTRTARVLVVDDERFFREAVEDALAGLPLRCEQAETGEEARKRAEDPGIEAVVLDVRMPGTGGIEVLRALRERRPDLRVIVLSAQTDQDLVLEALRLGAADYLAKPIHEEELRLAVTRAVEGTRLATRFGSLRGRLDRLADAAAELAARAGEGDAGPAARAERLAAPAVAALAEALGSARASLLVGDRDALRVAAIVGSDLSARELSPLPAAESVAGLAFGADRPLRIGDIDRDERCAGRPRRGRYASAQALLAPLWVRGEPFGVLCAADPAPERDFGDEDLALMRLFAAQLGALLGGASDTDTGAAAPEASAAADAGEEVGPDEGREHLRAELLRAACEAMTAEVEPEAVFARTLEPIAESLPALASLYVLDARAGALVLEASRGAGDRSERAQLPRDRGLTALALRSGRLVATAQPEEDARFDAAVDTPEDGAPGPLLVLPLRIRGKVLGVARIHPEREAAASPRTGELLAVALSAALRNALLYRSLLEAVDDVAAARRRAGGR